MLLNWHSHVKHNIPLNRYMAFSQPINAVALGVCTIPNPTAFLSFFIKLAVFFAKHKYVCPTQVSSQGWVFAYTASQMGFCH